MGDPVSKNKVGTFNTHMHMCVPEHTHAHTCTYACMYHVLTDKHTKTAAVNRFLLTGQAGSFTRFVHLACTLQILLYLKVMIQNKKLKPPGDSTSV